VQIEYDVLVKLSPIRGAPVAARKASAAPSRFAAASGCPVAAAVLASPSSEMAVTHLSPSSIDRLRLSS
jgi:hypothetical protein